MLERVREQVWLNPTATEMQMAKVKQRQQVQVAV
jgi:hypothetical protein